MDPKRAEQTRECPRCGGEVGSRQVYGVSMQPQPDGSWRCPECGYLYVPVRVAVPDLPEDVYAAKQEREAPREPGPPDGWHIPERKPGSHGGGGGRARKKSPKKGDRLTAPGNLGLCWRCGCEIGRDGRERYCGECKQAAKREGAAERKRREREKANVPSS